MARATASDLFVNLALKGAEEAVHRAFVKAAHQRFERLKPDYGATEIEQFVDGIAGRPIEAVKPFGVIHWRLGYLRKIASDGFEIIGVTSPVDTGRYRDARMLFVDGENVPGIEAIKDTTRRFVISNDVPYSRVVEVGIQGVVPWSTQPQVPRQGVYKAAASKLRSRYGHLANIEFGFVGLDAGTMLSGKPGNVSSARYPAIVVEAR